MMRWFVRLVLVVLLGLPLALLVALLLAVEDVPLVTDKASLTAADVERAKRVLQRNDPRAMRPGVLRTLVLPQQDLSLAAGYLAGRFAHGATRVVLMQGSASVRATFELPANPLGRYINVDALVVEDARVPRFEQLRVGRVPMPPVLCNWLLGSAVERVQADPRYAAASDVIKQVQMRDGLLLVRFEWSDAAASQIKSVLVPREDQERWRAYQTRLVELAAKAPSGAAYSLDQLLAPMLQLARQRGGAGGLAEENRAALIVLAFYVNGKGLAALVPAARDWPTPVQRAVTLAGRTDFAQHFTISAALTVTAGSPLSDVVGLYKEVDDSRGGSGFSFNDIAADRAGTRFGELAVATGGTATRLQQALLRGLGQTDLLPDVRDLPEFMAEPEFKRRFGGVGQPAYARMMADIERRITALPLYRP